MGHKERSSDFLTFDNHRRCVFVYRLLIAEDEPKLRRIVKDYFEKRDFQVQGAADGMEALALLKEQDFDIVLLDVMMPSLDGFAVCRAIRREKDTPVIFLTARVSEEDQLRGFQEKADDYITKPFSLPVLHAKIRALLERKDGSLCGRKLQSSGITVDLDAREVTVDGELVSMAPKVYDLLVYLMNNRGRILTREQILDHVWGQDVFCYDRAVDTTIKKLRHALGNRAGRIRTIVKVGYKFQEGDNES